MLEKVGKFNDLSPKLRSILEEKIHHILTPQTFLGELKTPQIGYFYPKY